MQPQTIEPSDDNERTPQRSRIREGYSSCTIHVATDKKNHLGRLALERSTHGRSLNYADLLRDAIDEYCARNPIGSPGAPVPALPPTPIERRALQAASLVHVRARAGKNATACGLLGVDDVALVDDSSDGARITCTNCTTIVMRNADALARPSRTTPATKPKKGGGAPKRRKGRR